MLSGLKIIKTIQSTDRFDAYEAQYLGRKVFAKKAKADKPRELLARVPENSKIADRIGQKTDFKFRTPEVYEQEGDWLVTEWIDGESFGVNLEKNISEVSDLLANFLLVFDKEPVTGGEVRKTFESQSLVDYMKEKLPKNLTADQIEVINSAKKLFDELEGTLVPSWQDGDIRPDHIFSDPKNTGVYVLVDPEHFDPRWPRFYSLANNAVKFWVRGPSEFSNLLIKKFTSGCGLSGEQIFKPLLASIIVRGISLNWEPEYGPGGTEYNRPRAQRVLQAALDARNLDDLLY